MIVELLLYKKWRKRVKELMNNKFSINEIEKMENEVLKIICNNNKKYINNIKNMALEAKVRRAAKINT